jgi:hypothetical protein
MLVVCLGAHALAAQGKKKTGDKGDTGGDKQSASDFQPQTWGPTECMSLQPGYAPKERGKTVKFLYSLHAISTDAPANIKKSQPFYLVADPRNPTRLYAGQELIVEIAYDLPKEVVGASPEDALKQARAITDALVPLISIDIGSTTATAINPNPVREAINKAATSFEGSGKATLKTVYACGYKSPLIGDTIPTVGVTALVKDVDSPLTLLQTSLPQAHTLSYFSISTGVAASTIKDQSFYRIETTPASGSTPAQYTTVSQESGPRVMPILFFTAYLFHPIDAEVPFEKKDLIPQPGVGFSLSSPSSDFLFGASSEFFRRNVQLVYGYHYGQVTRLVPGQAEDPTSKDAPQTTKKFTNGAFVGMTFNIDFIKGLFSSGKS